MNQKLCLAFCLLLIFAVDSAAQTRSRLSEAEAVQKAEEFIIEQGYTDLPPTKDKRKLKAEPVFGYPDALTMKLRRNSLERKAYGVTKEQGRNGYWIVVFRYNKENEEYRRYIPDWERAVETRGRAVSMNVYGRDIEMEHQNFNLSFAGLKKIAR